jgi:hypothetical protein
MGERHKPQAGASVQAAPSGPQMTPRGSPNVAQAVLLASALGQLGLALVITVYLARD